MPRGREPRCARRNGSKYWGGSQISGRPPARATNPDAAIVYTWRSLERCWPTALMMRTSASLPEAPLPYTRC
jgi:hypothetical protein